MLNGEGGRAVESRASGKENVRLRNWFGFAGLWFGMRPTVFAGVPQSPRDGAAALLWWGGSALAAIRLRQWLRRFR